MNLIKITPVSKIRLKEMVLKLMPEYGFIRMASSGLVIVLKKHRFSLRRTKVTIDSLCISVLPKLMAENAEGRGMGTGYRLLMKRELFKLMNSSDRNRDIIGYLWNQYIEMCLEVPKLGRLPERRKYTTHRTSLCNISMLNVSRLMKRKFRIGRNLHQRGLDTLSRYFKSKKRMKLIYIY